ncbi:hypothetical protein [Roseibium sp. Sym1]|uniref:hypothetical protein n=1 Tax=Roseibium sp. Sym1 TaxID=3016006 RepID=UPI0022B49094|nr:hypothetical protein [Roseibium sp. Sym1]
MSAKNDGKGRVKHSPPLFETFWAAGNKRFDPEARADGNGGFLRHGYYWSSEGFKSDGPFSSRRIAEARALKAIRDSCEDELSDYTDACEARQ